jgi:hypothetical protein
MLKPKVWSRVHSLYVPKGFDPDQTYFPRLDLITKDEPIIRYRHLDEPDFRKEVRRERLLSERGTATVPVEYIFGEFLRNTVPGFFGAAAETPVATSPTTLGATTARVFPFSLPRSDWIVKVAMATPSALASAMQLGIYGASGANRIWNPGALTTTANITVITPTLFAIAGGIFYHFAITNNNTVSATTSYLFSPAFVATIARFGTVAATNGVMPTTITPASITATVGGFPLYTWLAAAA